MCEVRGIRLSGLVAFLMYLGVHLFYLGGVGGRRISAAITAIGGLFGAREGRVLMGGLESMARSAPARPPGPQATQTTSEDASEQAAHGPSAAAQETATPIP